MHSTWLLVSLFSILVTNAAAQSCMSSKSQLWCSDCSLWGQNESKYFQLLIWIPIWHSSENFAIWWCSNSAWDSKCFQFINERFGLEFSLSLSLMSWASASSKMPPFNLLATDTVLVVWPSIAGLLQETARQNAILYLLVNIVLTLPERRHWE